MATAAEFLARILDDAPQPVWVVDEDGLIVFANPAAVTTLGYDDPAELYLKPSHATVHHRRPNGSPYAEGDCPMLAPRQSGETVHGEDEWFFFFFDAAEIRAAESHAAQRRIVENSAAVRREVARDLHDGAQQRLITMLISLQIAREELETDPAEARRLLDDAVGHAHAAIDELRELAAGLHPPVLAHRGLVVAVEELAARAVLPVAVSGSLPHRLPEAVEINAYFFVSEALTNTVKHANAARATVAIEVDDVVLSVEVRDDGIGGAGVDGAGSGLAGLADRVRALGGRMHVTSPPGRGTTVRAEIPVTHE